jgi:pimeloyl-ACP methyl ester carboxylesterase
VKSRVGVRMIVVHLILSFGFIQLLAQSVSKLSIPYGDNKNAGHYALLNGVHLYYETYGRGAPLVLIHGNGGNIAYMKPQIEYFCQRYRVIALDCRGRGKSELGKDSLSYMQMTRDVASLLSLLKVDSACFIGRSDGGIISLMMGIYYPEKVKKIAAFGANISPDTTAAYSHLVEQIQTDRNHAEEMIERNDTTKDWFLIKQLNRLMEFQPHISADDLKNIRSPVLILSCDRDVIREEHTVFIYRNIPKSNLCIFPGETHWITKDNPNLFNTTVAKFFSEPFKGEEVRK